MHFHSLLSNTSLILVVLKSVRGLKIEFKWKHRAVIKQRRIGKSVVFEVGGGRVSYVENTVIGRLEKHYVRNYELSYIAACSL